jgi:hypothetical protein
MQKTSLDSFITAGYVDSRKGMHVAFKNDLNSIGANLGIVESDFDNWPCV